MNESVRILIVEDQATDADLAQREIRRSVGACEFKLVETRNDYLNALNTFQPDIILSDFRMPRFDGMKALELALEHAPLTPLIIWTGSMNEDTAAECMRAGANNYVIKENIQRLGPAVIRALEERRLLLERKHAEETIRDLARFPEENPDPILRVTENGQILYSNSAGETWLNEWDSSVGGYLPEELKGYIFDAYKNEEKKTIDFKIKGRTFSTEIVPINDTGYINLYGRDTTERIYANEKVIAQEKHFRALIENSLENISLLAKDGTLLWENPAVNRTLGYNQDEHIGQNIFALMHPDDLEWAQNTFAELIKASGEQKSGVFRLLHRDGTWRWIEATATNLLDEPSVQAIVINYRDITERKQAEIEIQQRNDDLGLLNAINEAVIRGENLNAIVELLGKEMKRIFSSVGSTVYMLDPDEKFLNMKQYHMSPKLTRKIEQLIGSTIPLVQIPIKEDGYFQKVIKSGSGLITNEAGEIREWIGEFVETTFLPPATRGIIRKLIPQIHKLLNINSVITLPLEASGKAIGVLDVSRNKEFTADEFKRIENISRQLTAAIQRQQANEQIQRSEEFLQRVKNALSASIAILDETGIIVHINSAWRAFGEQNGLAHPEHGVGLNYLEICDSATAPYAEEAPAVAAAIREIIIGARKEAWIEYPCHSPNEKRWFVLRITKFDDGNRVWVVLAHENITERKQVEQTLKETSQQFLTLFEASPESIMLVDPHGEWPILDCNSMACAMNGYTRNELVGQSVNIFNLTPGYPDERADYLERIRKAGILHYETQHKHKDGRVFPIEVSTSIITLGGREVILGIDRDITERKQAEGALHKSEQRYRGLFENTPVAIWEEDFSEVKEYLDSLKDQGVSDFRAYFESHPDEMIQCKKMVRILDVNKAALEMYQAGSKDELIQLSTEDFSAGELENLIEDLVAIAEGKTSHGWEGADETCNGMPLEISLNRSVAPGYEDDFSRVIVTTVDITERKQAEFERQVLLDIMRGLADTKDPLEFFKLIHDSVARVIYAENFFAVYFHKETGLFDEIYSVDQYDQPAPPSKLEKSITSYVFRTGEPVIMTQPLFDELSAKGEVELVGTDSASWLGVPLKTPNGTIGVIVVQDYENPNRYSERDRDFLASIGSQVAIAIERMQTEKKLHEEQEKAQKYLDIAGVIMLALDQNGMVTLINQKGCEILGYSYNEVIGKNWVDTFLPESVRDELHEVFKNLVSGESGLSNYYHENPVQTKSGELHIIAWHNTMVRDEHGKIVSSLSSGEDITERKQTEANLRESEERFRQLANKIQEVFWMTDAITGNEIYISPAAEKIWGRSVETLLHDPNKFMEIILPEDRPMVMQTLEKQRGGENTEMEYRITHPDGSVHWIWDRAFPILDESGNVVRLAGIAADRTERKQAEEKTSRHLSELEALYENGLAVGQLLEPREIGERIINTFNRHLSWHHVTIRLLKDESDELELVAYSLPHSNEIEMKNAEQHFVTHISKVGQGLSGWVVQTGQPIRTGNVHDYPQYVDVYKGIRSGLYVPLVLGKFVIGVISVESEEADAFSPQDERLLATLANQAAVAFENARLYQSAQQELAERRRVEMALRTSETHYRELSDSITDVFFELDQDMRYTHWNKASEALTGVASKDAIGKTMLEIFGHSEEQVRIGKIYEKVLETHQSRTFETILPLNNEKHSFEINAYPSTRGVAVVAKDITDRIRSEAPLQKRFELMEFSANHSLGELMQKTMDEISDLTGSMVGFFHFVEEDQSTLGMQTWSTNALKLFKVPVSEGGHLPVAQAGVWAEAARQRRSLIHNEVESLPQRKESPQGHVQIVREMVIPIIRNEKLVAVLGVANKRQEYTRHDQETTERLADYAWDITERKRMEFALADERNQLAKRVDERTAELIKANSNLARALRVKDEFLANMSHELRTPLNAILGLSESLAEQIAGPLNEKQRKYITTISESGHHLLSLINDILDLAKIEAGQITLDINKVDVHSVCQASLRMIKQLAQKKNQEVIMNIDNNTGLMWADERRLKQMIVNLLSNAVKFTPENGTLGLDVHIHEEENRVEISVWDRGIGISENDLSRLFSPFVQLDSGLARESSGTGLGLALVSQMARLHGGSVTAMSNPNEGSRFTIKLPWEPALARDPVERLKNTGRLGLLKPDSKNRKNILLIEDTVEVIMMIKDYLETAGYDVTTAQDGIEGINQAGLIQPDLILMDIQMPRMDGIEATKRLRADPKFKDVPIIALTALAMQSDRNRCIEAGMNEYISKPVNLRALVKIIKKCLSMGEEKTRSI